MKKLRKVKSQWCAVMVCGLSAAMLIAAPAPSVFAETTGANASSTIGSESSQTETPDMIEQSSNLYEDTDNAAVPPAEPVTGSADLTEGAPSDNSSEASEEVVPASNEGITQESGSLPVSGNPVSQPSDATPLESAPAVEMTAAATTLPEVNESSSDVAVSYTAVIAKGDFTLDSLPWGYSGYAFRYMTNDFVGQKIEVIRESQNGLYALVVLNGEKLGWVDKRALSDIVIIPKVQDLASAIAVDYTARISGTNFSLDSLPWGYAGYMYMETSTAYLDQKIQAEKETANGQYVLISLNGEKLGWIDKRALSDIYSQPKVQDITSALTVDYAARIGAAGFSIDSLPWGYAGYAQMTTSSAYLNQSVQAIKETANGLYALIAQNGNSLGWIDKRALTDIYIELKVQELATGITVDYKATIAAAGFSIDSLPWGYAGYGQIDTTSNHTGERIQAVQESPNGLYVLISSNGTRLGWVDKRALTDIAVPPKLQDVASAVVVAYTAAVTSPGYSIDSLPWGYAGYQLMATSTDYLGQRVEAVKETANGAYVLLSMNGKKIGWIDKKALGDFSYRSQAQNISGGTVVSYSPTIAKAGFSVDTLPWGYAGYQWRTSTDSYVGQKVDAIRESADGHYVLISLNGNYIGWVDKAALSGLPTYAKGPDWTVINGYFRSNSGVTYYIGNSYIIVSLSHQSVWAYKGETMLVSAPVITGKPSANNATPRGLFYIQPFKQSPSVLIGADYASPVSFWIPFVGNMVGLHDSSWQTHGYGGDVYLYYGSHGCVNTPYEAVRTLYYSYPVGTPVVVY
ncbi:SH3 domain-containing protein [Trichococcus patagoniensis]|uniref:SH3 domain-containing protein n=1 Tax=Trichococcus patagoniensis TaxID=382641 RepID=A0A2T5IL58_9LACT|nr:GW dipeptide domain-containing protein [Trichococcus patagoniensis]PTQ84562.1 SH3 domain-containing protein [Trichococcus patagoniensis]